MSEQDNLPGWDGRPGHYEAWYLTLSDPSTRTGYWIRYTLAAPDRGSPGARLWFARFDRDRPERTFGINRGFPITEYASTPGMFEVRIGSAVLRSGRLTGALEGDGRSVRWDLDFDAGGPTYRMLPAALYRGGLAPSKPFVPNPDVRFSGTIEVDSETVRLDGVPGQQGHVHGARHAERWAWAHCNAFDGEPGTVLEALSAQGRRGPMLTPFTTFVGVRREGRWLRMRAVSRRRSWGLGWWRLEASSRTHRLVGSVRLQPENLVRAVYHDPDGSERHCHNGEVASARVTLFERRAGGFDEVATLRTEAAAHAEWGGRTPAPQVAARHVRVDD